MFVVWKNWFRTRPQSTPIGDSEWELLLSSSALFDGMSIVRLHSLRLLAARFLAEKRFHAAGGHLLKPAHSLTIAALACLPVINLGYAALRGWYDVIVYPGGFSSRREHHDEATGVITEHREEMIGEAWDRGPIVLSWADIEEDLARPFEGFNVVIHEIAHKLDMLDGAMNGTPALPAEIPRQRWNGVMQQAFDRFVIDVEDGVDVAIDPYAAESVEEFFAVVTEYQHSAPDLLAAEMPEVAELLAAYYD